MVLQVVQIIGALGIVGAFAAAQFRLVQVHDLSYLLTNIVSAGALTATAVINSQYGFVISNGFWVLVAAVGLLDLVRRRQSVQQELNTIPRAERESHSEGAAP